MTMTEDFGLSGTSLRGYITTTRAHIETVFGSPTIDLGVDGRGSKTTTEWYLLFEDGTRATIYDWKRYEDGAPEMDERYEWHIGGDSLFAVSRVVEALGIPGQVFPFA
jgi:hypothetical protein